MPFWPKGLKLQIKGYIVFKRTMLRVCMAMYSILEYTPLGLVVLVSSCYTLRGDLR